MSAPLIENPETDTGARTRVGEHVMDVRIEKKTRKELEMRREQVVIGLGAWEQLKKHYYELTAELQRIDFLLGGDL